MAIGVFLALLQFDSVGLGLGVSVTRNNGYQARDRNSVRNLVDKMTYARGIAGI
jgi:hypothetical protein